MYMWNQKSPREAVALLFKENVVIIEIFIMQRLGNFFYEIHNVIKYFFRVNMTGKMCATVTSQNATKSQKGGCTKEQPYIVRRNKGRRGKKWRGWRRGGPGGARWMGTLPAICPDVRSVRSLSGWPALLKAAFWSTEGWRFRCLSSGQKKHRVSSLGDCQAQW